MGDNPPRTSDMEGADAPQKAGGCPEPHRFGSDEALWSPGQMCWRIRCWRSCPVAGSTARRVCSDIADAVNTLFGICSTSAMGVGAAVAAFFVMWGAFLYMSAAGSPHQMERGKSAIVNALVGFSIVLMARVIAGMIQDSIGA